ncbi:MAG: SDR family NAD(P)-dependent oxidoreductase [Rhodobacteraceae bacterium]|nr:SDR family NAD(P)-dependent oxidoreductase [Paracoccaceae bacterium]
MAQKQVLVTGAYGFIGSEVVRALKDAGYRVIGCGRDPVQAQQVLGALPFRVADLRDLVTADTWTTYLDNVDLVVNCAGLLQDMAPGDLEAVHHLSIAALGQACASRGIGLIQISAAGADPGASTEFMRSKARGDSALGALDLPLWCLRPGLVIGQGAFGGTLLLRMLAATPGVQVMAMGASPIQSVGMEDLCRAVVEAADGALPPGRYDLVEDAPRSLSEVLAETRRWLGVPPARWQLEMPTPVVRVVAGAADVLGWFGWRSPLRSTAMQAIADGVTGDPETYRGAMGHAMNGLPQIHAKLRVGREQRLAARMALMMPLCVAVLSVFWLLSGLIGLWHVNAAAALLEQAGWGSGLAHASVVFWALVDLALGAAILWRRWAGRACLGMAVVSALYLGASAVVTPELWVDPLGPMIKVLPGLVLALVTYQMLEDR